MVPLIGLALSLAGEFAPVAAKAIAAAVGAGKPEVAEKVAGQVVDLAKKVTGTATGQEAQAALRADPEKAMAFQKEMAAIEADVEKAYLADRQDARRRDVALAQAGISNSRANWMIVGDVLGLVVCLVLLYYLPANAPGEIRGIISTIAGFFGLGLRDAHQFEFGSSRGSQDKTALLGSR